MVPLQQLLLALQGGAGGSKWTQPAEHALLEQTRQLGGAAASHVLVFSC